MFWSYLGVCLLLILFGILAIKLPRRYNIFRLKRGYESLVGDSASNLAPKILGWLLIAMGSLGVFGLAALLLLSKLSEAKTEREKESWQASIEETRREDEQFVVKVLEHIQKADGCELFRRTERGWKKQEPANESEVLKTLKSVLTSDAIKARENLSQAPIVFPNRGIKLTKGDEVVVQLQTTSDGVGIRAYLPEVAGSYMGYIPGEEAAKLALIYPSVEESDE